MSYLSPYARRKLTGHLTGTAWTPPVLTYLGVFTNVPNDTTPGVLVVEAGLKAVSWQTNLDNTRSNTSSITFGPASSDWGEIQSVGLFDSAGGAGNFLFAQEVDPLPVGIGDTYSVPIGELVFTLRSLQP